MKNWLTLFAAGVAALVLATTSNTPTHAGEPLQAQGESRFILLNTPAAAEFQAAAIPLTLHLCSPQAIAASFDGEAMHTTPIKWAAMAECSGEEYKSPLLRYGKRVATSVADAKGGQAYLLQLMPGEEGLDWSQGLPWNHGSQPAAPTAAPPTEPAPTQPVTAPPPTPAPAPVPQATPPQTGQAPQKGPYPDVCVQDENSWLGTTDRCRAALKAAGWTDATGRVVSRQELIGRCVTKVEDHNARIDECLGGGGGYLSNRGQDALDEKCRDLDNDAASLACGFTAAEMRAQGADRLMCGKRAYASNCYDNPEYHASLGGNGLAGGLAGKF